MFEAVNHAAKLKEVINVTVVTVTTVFTVLIRHWFLWFFFSVQRTRAVPYW